MEGKTKRRCQKRCRSLVGRFVNFPQRCRTTNVARLLCLQKSLCSVNRNMILFKTFKIFLLPPHLHTHFISHGRSNYFSLPPIGTTLYLMCSIDLLLEAEGGGHWVRSLSVSLNAIFFSSSPISLHPSLFIIPRHLLLPPSDFSCLLSFSANHCLFFWPPPSLNRLCSFEKNKGIVISLLIALKAAAN